MQDQRRSLQAIPVEIILQIFKLLDARQIARCREVSPKSRLMTSLILKNISKVCTYFKNAIDDSVALQYTIELAICGYTDGPYSDRTITNTPTERLRRLRKHIDAWNDLDWVESQVTVPSVTFYTICEGVLLVLSDETLTCIQLPSRIRDLPLRIWKLHDIDMDLSVDGMDADPQNNLLVLATG
jgi:hypothetical protein